MTAVVLYIILLELVLKLKIVHNFLQNQMSTNNQQSPQDLET